MDVKKKYASDREHVFFSLGKPTEGPAGATRGGLERATEGPRPSVQAPVLEPGRVRSPAGSRTNRATLGLHISPL